MRTFPGPLKEAVRTVLSSRPSRASLRCVTRSHLLPAWLRSLVHRKVAKKTRFAEGMSFRVPVNGGIELELLHHGSANYFYWLGEYEPGSTEVFCALARQSETILDIGSNDGVYSLLAAASNPRAVVHAFEPGQQVARICQQNLALNPTLSSRVHLWQLALGNAVGRAPFYVVGGDGGNSSLNPSFRTESRVAVVDVLTGDAFLEREGVARVDLIKVDTESTEPAVLQGFRRCLARDRPHILCEVLHGRTESQIESLLQPYGYKFYWVTREGIKHVERIEGDPTYRFPNYLFSTADLALDRTSITLPP